MQIKEYSTRTHDSQVL